MAPTKESGSGERAGEGQVFETTHWSVILAAAQGNGDGEPEALETLCRTYWFPVYAFVRHRGHGPEDAEDLTQAFFTRCLAHRSFAVADPARGRFRAFLLTSLRHFLANEWDRAHTRKRGGGEPALPLDENLARARYAREGMETDSPDTLYDRAWARTLLDQVGARLREEYTRTGRFERFQWLDRLLPGERCDLSYAELGQRHGLSVEAVKSEVHRFRARFRLLLRREIARTVTRSEDIDAELHDLRAALAG